MEPIIGAALYVLGGGVTIGLLFWVYDGDESKMDHRDVFMVAVWPITWIVVAGALPFVWLTKRTRPRPTR